MLLLLAWIGGAAASDATWTGATNNLWSTNSNWNTGSRPGTGDIAFFTNGGNGSTSINLNGPVNINYVWFDSSSCAAYTFQAGNTLTFDNGGRVMVTATVANAQTFSSTLGMNGNLTLTNDSTLVTATVTFAAAGAVVFGGTTSRTLTLEGSNTGINTFTPNLDNPASGTTSLIKNGAGTWVLNSASNTYTGTTTINQGILALGPGDVFATAAPVNLNGGTLSTGITIGYGDLVGALTVSSASRIYFGTGGHNLTFTSLTSFSGPLTIDGWTGTAGNSGTSGHLNFNDTANLTPGVLSQINFTGYAPGAMLIGIQVVPAVPEPSHILLLCAAGAGLGGFCYRRLKHRRKGTAG